MGKRNDDPDQFVRDLAESNSIENTNWWHSAHRQAFKNVVCVRPCEDIDIQKSGIDRYVTTTTRFITIEEKLDSLKYANFALETKSTARGDDEGTPGWINKPMSADILAYGFKQRKEIYYFQTAEFFDCWKANGDSWKKAYGERKVYSSHARVVPVPIDVMLFHCVNHFMIRLDDDNHFSSDLPHNQFTELQGVCWSNGQYLHDTTKR